MTSSSWFRLAAVIGICAAVLFLSASCTATQQVLDEMTSLLSEAEMQRTLNDKSQGDMIALEGAQEGNTVKVVLGGLMSFMSALAAAKGLSKRRRGLVANDVDTAKRVARGVEALKAQGETINLS